MENKSSTNISDDENYTYKHTQHTNIILRYMYDVNEYYNKNFAKIMDYLKRIYALLNDENFIVPFGLLCGLYKSNNVKYRYYEDFNQLLDLLKIEYINNYEFFLIVIQMIKLYTSLENHIYFYDNYNFEYSRKKIKEFLENLSLECCISNFMKNINENIMNEKELYIFISLLSLNFCYYLKYDDVLKLLMNKFDITEKNKEMLNNKLLFELYKNVKTNVEQNNIVKKIDKFGVNKKYIDNVKTITNELNNILPIETNDDLKTLHSFKVNNFDKKVVETNIFDEKDKNIQKNRIRKKNYFMSN